MSSVPSTGKTSWPVLDARDTDRYGIFLRPDPRTCEVAAALQDLLRRQFGLVSAAVFPPHITLLGNVAVTSGESDLMARVGSAVAGHGPLELANPGPALRDGALLCPVDTPELTELARAVEAALVAVRGRTDNDYLTGQTSTASFSGHLTVAGQDLALRPDLQEEVAAFVAELAPPFPARLVAGYVSAFRFRSAMWPGVWWQDMTWLHLRSWQLNG